MVESAHLLRLGIDGEAILSRQADTSREKLPSVLLTADPGIVMAPVSGAKCGRVATSRL